MERKLWLSIFLGTFFLTIVELGQSTNIAVRLAGGTATEGRVEVQYKTRWGRVCDDSFWSLQDGYVVCHMLNYSKATWTGTAKVQGSGKFVLHQADCRGLESSLEDCKKILRRQSPCSSNKDGGVRCAMLTGDESSVAVRLVGYNQSHIGFVEVNYKSTWRPVCDDTWDILDAHVVCRMLGYNASLAPLREYRKGVNSLRMAGVECSGKEKTISECYHRGWTNKKCNQNRNYYAGVVCKTNKDPPPVQVRLEDGSSPNSGRVAVRYGNVWGTVCNRGLDIDDAKVICRMLGYPGAVLTFKTSPGNGTIWLTKLEYNGTENSIIECRHPGWGQSSCHHFEDVGVMCKISDAPRFQINGTQAITESTVVILFNDSQTPVRPLKSVYQVAVEKRDNDQRYKSHEQPTHFVYNEVNVTMATQMDSHSYITAEILGPISNLTIGDGQYYHGYYNAPLDPGSRYTIHVRIVTMAMDGKRIYGESSFVELATKSPITHQASAPGLRFDGTNTITESTVVILFNGSQTTDGQLKSFYQVAVEKRDNNQRFNSHDQQPSFVYNEVNITMAAEMRSHSYITAEILRTIPSLKIGDRQYYLGYYNAPLEPGSMYRVHARIVTMAMDGKKVYGKSSFVEFTTKSPVARQGRSSGSVKSNSDTNQNALIIGLAAAGLLLLCVVIGMSLCHALGNKKKENNDGKPEMIEIPRAKQVTAGKFNPLYY